MPLAAPTIAAIVTASISAATAVGTGIYAGYQQRQQGKASEKLAEYNAKVAEQDAEAVARNARIGLTDAQREKESMLSRQRALLAYSGVDTTSGSPLLIQAASSGEFERNITSGFGDAVNGVASMRQQSVMDRFAGRSARRAGNSAMLGSILGGVGTGVSRASSLVGTVSSDPYFKK
jgi:hypothetical protein